MSKLFYSNKLFLFYIIAIIKETLQQGVCSNVIPNSVSDCMINSNSTNYCCLLKAYNVPAQFTTCISMPLDNTSPVITVGNMYYTVNCRGGKDFEIYFPFEDQYTACGVNNPIIASDCSKFNTNNIPCCIAANDTAMQNNPTCYQYPKNNKLMTKNYTERNSVANINIYFACIGNYLGYKKIYLIMTIIILFIN